MVTAGLQEPAYGGSLRRHAESGDSRLFHLRFDNAIASLNLWNFLLTEEDRLAAARQAGRKLVGCMKDLGTIPVMAYSLPNLVAFYPDGAWWMPCFKEFGSRELEIADRLGIDDSFCPVRAMLGAIVGGHRFPIPDLFTCSVGATCDDYSAIAQFLNGLGYPVLWWEIPVRHPVEPGEPGVPLPGGGYASRAQVRFVRGQLHDVCRALETLAGTPIGNRELELGIANANRVRAILASLRHEIFTAPRAPLPALEILVAEMLALHFCSDYEASLGVLDGLLTEVRRRRRLGLGYATADAARLFWINPVADIKMMNLLEESGGRLCGTDFMFTHALDPIPVDMDPLEALARSALADPMVGSADERARRIMAEAAKWGAEGVVISKIPGASHCALEGIAMRRLIEKCAGLPVVEIEVPSVSDGDEAYLRTRLEALVETVKGRRKA
jgi:hypothetical protein